MGIVIATTIGFVVWISLWSIGVKSFDAFMVLMVIVVLGAATHIIRPMLPGRRDPEA